MNPDTSTPATAQRLARRLGANCVRLAAAVLACLLFGFVGHATATQLNTITSFHLINGMAVVEFAEDPGSYYLLQFSPDLIHWQSADMTLGTPSQVEVGPGVLKGFFREIGRAHV